MSLSTVIVINAVLDGTIVILLAAVMAIPLVLRGGEAEGAPARGGGRLKAPGGLRTGARRRLVTGAREGALG
jgi:hypothetical protein